MMNFSRLGWVLAAAILGVLAASGFQGGMEKTAIVDISSMIETSDLGKANIAALTVMKTSREDLLKYIDENRVLTVDQARNLRTLWLKDSLSVAEKASFESLKADINAQAKKNLELGQKANLTPEERSLLQEYSNRSASMEQLAGQWYTDFSQEIQQAAQQKRVDTLAKAKAAAQAAALAGGFTLVFDSSVAVYSANDITADALKAMNAKK